MQDSEARRILEEQKRLEKDEELARKLASNASQGTISVEQQMQLKRDEELALRLTSKGKATISGKTFSPDKELARKLASNASKGTNSAEQQVQLKHDEKLALRSTSKGKATIRGNTICADEELARKLASNTSQGTISVEQQMQLKRDEELALRLFHKEKAKLRGKSSSSVDATSSHALASSTKPVLPRKDRATEWKMEHPTSASPRTPSNAHSEAGVERAGATTTYSEDALNLKVKPSTCRQRKVKGSGILTSKEQSGIPLTIDVDIAGSWSSPTNESSSNLKTTANGSSKTESTVVLHSPPPKSERYVQNSQGSTTRSYPTSVCSLSDSEDEVLTETPEKSKHNKVKSNLSDGRMLEVIEIDDTTSEVTRQRGQRVVSSPSSRKDDNSQSRKHKRQLPMGTNNQIRAKEEKLRTSTTTRPSKTKGHTKNSNSATSASGRMKKQKEDRSSTSIEKFLIRRSHTPSSSPGTGVTGSTLSAKKSTTYFARSQMQESKVTSMEPIALDTDSDE